MANELAGDYNQLHERFVAAREQAALAAHHNKRIPQLEEELSSEEAKHEELLIALASEEGDVAKLEKFSLKRLMAKVGEGVDVALEREQLEAQAAADEVVESSEHMAGVRNEIARLNNELAEVGETGPELESARFDLETFVRRNYADASEELGALDTQIADIKAEVIELEEAVAAADFALLELGELAKALKSAIGASNFDVMGGGALMSMYKREKVRVSSEKSRAAGLALEIFDREVNDTALRGVDLRLEGAMNQEFLDVWFDNIFTDTKVHNQIHAARENTTQVLNVVNEIRSELQALITGSGTQVEAIAEQRADILAAPRDA